MYASILVGVEPGPHAARAAELGALLARTAGCRLVLVHVVVDPGAEGSGWLPALASSVATPAASTLTVLGASAAEGLLAVQADHADSLLCLATSAHRGSGELVVGSTAATVLRMTDRPLVLLGPQAEIPDRIRRIVVGVDDSEEADAAASTAGVWGLLLRARIDLVRVAPPSEHGASHAESADLARLARRIGHTGTEPICDVLHDHDAAAALVRRAREVGASLIAIGHSRHLTDRLGGTTTAADVVRSAPCPVLVARRPHR